MFVSMLFSFYNVVALILLGDPQPPAPRGPFNPPEQPIDSALWVLLVFGVLLGIYFIVKNMKATNRLA